LWLTNGAYGCINEILIEKLSKKRKIRWIFKNKLKTKKMEKLEVLREKVILASESSTEAKKVLEVLFPQCFVPKYGDRRNSIIGKKVILCDNSQQKNLLTGEKSNLAGFSGKTGEIVEIISEPYMLEYFSCVSTWDKSEFITVLYRGTPYVAMNIWSEVK